MLWHRNEPSTLAEEAARWLIELEEGGTDVLSGFAAWIETSPRHVEEFLLATATWKQFDGIDTERRIEVQRLIEDARNNVRTLQPATTPGIQANGRARRTRRTWVIAAAALGCALLGIGVWLLQDREAHEYATARGEQRAFKLEDGSIVHLNTQSRVQLHFSRTSRDVRLLEGEALFTVEHDDTRPFRVTADHTIIQAIGTRFDVYRSSDGTTVSVVEGVVRVSPNDLPRAGSARVSAGEQVRVSADGVIVKRPVGDVGAVVAWRERRLVFRGNPLTEVVREFNRYNALQIRVEGEAVRDKQLTGVFDADDPHSLLLFLRRDPTIAVDETDHEAIIRER